MKQLALVLTFIACATINAAAYNEEKFTVHMENTVQVDNDVNNGNVNEIPSHRSGARKSAIFAVYDAGSESLSLSFNEAFGLSSVSITCNGVEVVSEQCTIEEGGCLVFSLADNASGDYVVSVTSASGVMYIGEFVK